MKLEKEDNDILLSRAAKEQDVVVAVVTKKYK